MGYKHCRGTVFLLSCLLLRWLHQPQVLVLYSLKALIITVSKRSVYLKFHKPSHTCLADKLPRAFYTSLVLSKNIQRFPKTKYKPPFYSIQLYRLLGLRRNLAQDLNVKHHIYCSLCAMMVKRNFNERYRPSFHYYIMTLTA